MRLLQVPVPDSNLRLIHILLNIDVRQVGHTSESDIILALGNLRVLIEALWHPCSLQGPGLGKPGVNLPVILILKNTKHVVYYLGVRQLNLLRNKGDWVTY